MPMIARATHSQLKKLKKLMMEKMSWEKAYIRVMTHWKQTEGQVSLAGAVLMQEGARGHQTGDCQLHQCLAEHINLLL